MGEVKCSVEADRSRDAKGGYWMARRDKKGVSTSPKVHAVLHWPNKTSPLLLAPFLPCYCFRDGEMLTIAYRRPVLASQSVLAFSEHNLQISPWPL